MQALLICMIFNQKHSVANSVLTCTTSRRKTEQIKVRKPYIPLYSQACGVPSHLVQTLIGTITIETGSYDVVYGLFHKNY